MYSYRQAESGPFLGARIIASASREKESVAIFPEGAHKILRKRSKLIIAPPFKMDTPVEGLNSDYIKQQTQMLQLRMSDLMEEFIMRERQVSLKI